MLNRVFMFFLFLLVSTATVASELDLKIDMLVRDTVSWDGGKYSYPQGDAEIAVIRLGIPKGYQIKNHCHTIPLAAYVTKGQLQVETNAGEKRTFNEGEAFIEVMNTIHHGLGMADETELIVVYMGAKGVPLSVKPENETFKQHCK